MPGPKSFRTVLRRFRQVFVKPEPETKNENQEVKTVEDKMERQAGCFWNKGHKIIDAEKLNDFLKPMVEDSFARNFIAYKIAEHEDEFLITKKE